MVMVLVTDGVVDEVVVLPPVSVLGLPVGVLDGGGGGA